jgi:hypothetical protein
VRPEGLGKLIKIIHLIGSRTRDLSVCNIVHIKEYFVLSVKIPAATLTLCVRIIGVLDCVHRREFEILENTPFPKMDISVFR